MTKPTPLELRRDKIFVICVALILIVLLVSCNGGNLIVLDAANELATPIGLVSNAVSHPHVEPEFAPYVAEFASASAKPVTIAVQFGDIDGWWVRLLAPKQVDYTKLGQCEYWLAAGIKRVVINKSAWDRSNACMKRFVIFHELGHCVLLRNHTDEYVQIGSHTLKASLMSTWMYEDECVTYQQHWEYYLSELFSQRND